MLTEVSCFECHVSISNAHNFVILFCILISFDRKLCETLAFRLTIQFEDREDAIREHTRRSDEKKRLQAEKKAKRARDATEKEKEKR